MKWFIIFLVLVLCLSLLPRGEATVSTQIRYFTTGTLLYAMDMTAYNFGLFDNSQDFFGMGSDYATRTVAGDRKVQFGIRVYHLDWHGAYTEITSETPVAIVERINGVNAQGMQNATWECPETSLSRNETLMLEVYNRYFTTIWLGWTLFSSLTYSIAAWSSEGLGMANLTASTWTVYYYTYRYFTGSTVLRFYFGNATYNSHIEGIGVNDGATPIEEPFTEGIFLGAIVLGALGFFGFLFLLVKKHT